MTGIMCQRGVSREAAARTEWRRLGWVTWRQHRAALAATVGVLGVLCAGMLIEGLSARSSDLGRAACQLAGGCAGRPSVYSPAYAGTASTIALALQILPVLIGVFVGAPLLGRELETGTFRFAWTQECGRSRWLVAKLVPLAAVVASVSAAFSVMTSWYLQPFISSGLISGIRSPEFNVRGIDFAAWTVVAFSIAVFAGAVARRVLPAMFVALVLWVGLFVATIGLLRPHYAAPLVGKASAVTVHWWIVGQSAGGTDVLYQPESRFWLLQAVEAGWLIGLALVLLATTLWLVNRRPS